MSYAHQPCIIPGDTSLGGALRDKIPPGFVWGITPMGLLVTIRILQGATVERTLLAKMMYM